MDKFVVKTTKSEKDAIDEQCARFIFANNCSFRTVDHVEFKKLCEILRPGYKPPDRQSIGNKWLEIVHQNLEESCSIASKNQSVNMSFDGWSNVKNEPIVTGSITMDNGEVLIAKSVDTSGEPHTSVYMKSLLKMSITETQNKFKCVVRSVCTDDARNMALMRKLISEECDDILLYACSAHALHNLAQDIGKIDGNITIRSHVIHILKYFKSHHQPYAAYKAAGGSGIVLPLDVRWNTTCQAL